MAQLNMSLLSQVQYDEALNDVWGWVAPDGTEYALVGVRNGISIVSLADPRRATEVAFVPGQNSRWRDIKTWGNFAYAVADQRGTTDGLFVIDLSNLPESASYTQWKPALDSLGTLEKCHNLYIDEHGFCYLAGCNVNDGGVIFLDVKSTPGNPVYVGKGPSTYSHDVFVRDNRMYSSEIHDDRLGIYEVTDKSEPVLLATQVTPEEFTHNAWLSDDSKVVFTTDEVRNAPVTAYDISDLDDIEELDQYRPAATLGMDVVPHNVHVWKNWLVISYYTDGGIIVDATKPDNLVEVGNFDTFLGGNGGFNGAWGLYPFFESEKVLVSDISNGLYVLQANYVRACYLEGKVTDINTGQQLNGVKVEILSDQVNVDFSNPAGNYKTGQEKAGRFNVRFFKEGYKRKVVEVELNSGETSILNVKLEPENVFRIGGRTVDIIEGTAAPNAFIRVFNDYYTYQTRSDANGDFSLEGVYEDNYSIEVGAWGFQYKIFENILIDDFAGITLGLEGKIYRDDFYFDFDWINTADETVSAGFWDLGEPYGTTFFGEQANPGLDIQEDWGDRCYVTGNIPLQSNQAAAGDLDNGKVTLISPKMDLQNFEDPFLTFYYWFYNAGGEDTPDDAIDVFLANGNDTVLITSITESQSAWQKAEFHLGGDISLTNNMTIIFETSDLEETSHIVEAGIDGFLLTDGEPLLTNTEEEIPQDLVLNAFPNPHKGHYTVRYSLDRPFQEAFINIFNILGQLTVSTPISNPQGQIDVNQLSDASGISIVQLWVDGEIVGYQKVVKTD